MPAKLTFEEAHDILLKHKQAHILQDYDKLSATDKVMLLRQIASIDWNLVDRVKAKDTANDTAKGELTPPTTATLESISLHKQAYTERGLFMIRAGKVGAVMLAGGMGTRLGVDKPKGAVNIGQTRKLYIFECLFKNLLKVTAEAKTTIPLYIMTSENNDEFTKSFLKQNNFFGYPEREVFFFKQKSNVCTDLTGNLFFEKKGRLASSPNGNGGWFSSMQDAGLIPGLKKRGVDWLNVFSVDNVLQSICDPAFIGATVMGGHDSGAKAVKKISPEEKVGVFCKRDGKPAVVEYYEISDFDRTKKDSLGQLYLNYGVILNYLFRVDKLFALGEDSFPVHFVRKSIPYINSVGAEVNPKEPNGYKFETLAADMVGMMEDCLCYEVVRNMEFAPIKNATGEDSIDTARVLLKAMGVLV